MKIEPFVFPGIRSRVVFGSGTIGKAAAEIERLGRARALVLSTANHRDNADALAARLGDLSAGVFDGAAMHTPIDVTDRAIEAFRSSDADCVISLGGGSTTGLGKAIAVRTGTDQIVIPTTYAGSEMTDVLGETSVGEKVTLRDPAILPETVIYDVDLTLSLPVAISVTSGLNAMAHAAEALYAPDRSPILTLMAVESIRAFAAALPTIVVKPGDPDARGGALYGAWLAGATLGGASMGLHHKLCHVLGGSFGTPHAGTHAILLPHTVGYNAAVAGDLLRPVSEALDGSTPGKALHRFAAGLGAPQNLRELGLSEADLDGAARSAVRNSYVNPRPFDEKAIRRLLQNAWDGNEPEL